MTANQARTRILQRAERLDAAEGRTYRSRRHLSRLELAVAVGAMFAALLLEIT
jgi:hypothetical protein